ncbi:serine protein kinase RIO [archaeon]|mgnify:CR=1 FL=1|jgi:RIO kinase 1|nr:serine protein kinase RIO [archaeon]MBT3730512.1 serine protein kinase RIO [archaeon]MBT4669422.1 serine protein kinase RIO [archaeon]MBT5029825.1 serine protein kinase RIO [archaeon]MBT5288038.1 serine protein kinase RIO [archaeon]
MAKNKFIAYENVFDQSTLRALFKLSSQGYFDELGSPISIGKESNVFTVLKGEEKRVVKIYRTAANFKKMYEYMRPDPRFSRVKGSKLTVIYAWARKEFRNLLKAREMGVTVPIPYAVHKNVLVMEYIDGKKLLHDRPKEPKKFYEKLIKEVKKLKTAKLVHGDISEYNVLNFKENPVLIDFSHAVDLRYPNIERLVKRDVNNMVRYFRKLGLKLEEEEEFEKTWQDKK